MGERKRQLATVIPLMAPEPALKPIASTLAAHDLNAVRAVCRLRDNLLKLLTIEGAGKPRPPTAVLRSGTATKQEMQLTAAALMSLTRHRCRHRTDGRT